MVIPDKLINSASKNKEIKVYLISKTKIKRELD